MRRQVLTIPLNPHTYPETLVVSTLWPLEKLSDLVVCREGPLGLSHEGATGKEERQESTGRSRASQPNADTREETTSQVMFTSIQESSQLLSNCALTGILSVALTPYAVCQRQHVMARPQDSHSLLPMVLPDVLS